MNFAKRFVPEIFFIAVHFTVSVFHITDEVLSDGLHWDNIYSLNGLLELSALFASIGSLCIFISTYRKTRSHKYHDK